MLNPADAAFLDRLAASCPPGLLRPAEPRDLEEPRGRFQGRAAAVAMPRDVAEVAAVIRACAAARVGVVPLGGGTGLVGGQVKPDGPVPLVLSLARMRRVRAVLPDEEAVVVEAGATLAELQAAAEAAGLVFPLSLAAQGSCTIGGNLATNAGGTQVLRYGNARDLCLGIEAVLADGSVLHGLKTLRKDNTGYDLRQLLIGSEGTLGIITAASLRLFPRPAHVATAWLALPDPEAALALFGRMRAALGTDLSGFELIQRTGLDFLGRFMPGCRAPLDRGPWFVLAEVAAGRHADPRGGLESVLAEALEAGLITDGVLAESLAQAAAIWRVREAIPEAGRLRGAIASHDVSLPRSRIAQFLHAAGRRIAGIRQGLVINCFGHLGDGNLHYNLFPPDGDSPAAHRDIRDALSEAVHDLVHEMDGSISAEHGIGRLRRADLRRYGDPAKLAAMRAIKAALDPAGILNPGAVL
ncbi:MAG: D-2-hydroxyacid dehydrogenase [Paracoccaceae bacterium]|nr:MAG: D-2-hydroxyacid dehydrogenase [Paracoccaceae bacterium]